MAEPITEEELAALVDSEIRSARSSDNSDLADKREKALEYYNGEMNDLPVIEGRSSAVSRDVSETVNWMLPGIIRVFTASGDMVKFQPETPEDEAFTEQASDYCNHIFSKDNEGYKTLYSGTHDSLLHGNGMGKIYWDDSEICVYADYTGLTEQQVALLADEPGVEILAQAEGEPQIVESVDPETGDPAEMSVPTLDIKIKRVKDRGRIKIENVAPEDFFLSADAVSIDDARLVGLRSTPTRSELIEMGFDRERIESLTTDETATHSSTEDARHNDEYILDMSNPDYSQETVELFECYIKVDIDGDGVSEIVQVYFTPGDQADAILDWSVVDEHPFFEIPCRPIPHRWNAESVYDMVGDLQRIKTVATRQMLDNLYSTNMPQAEVEKDSIANMQALLNPKLGGVILKKRGSAPINWNTVPFIGQAVLGVISYIDQVKEGRTGVSRNTMALDPETLQNQTATAVQAGRDSAYSQIELVARNQAELGWRPMFRKMLRLVIRNQDRPRTIRLRDKWVKMDPRYWNADMDCEINIGLGTGSRDRDMQMLQVIKADQVALAERLAQVSPGEALKMLPKVVETMRKSAESAGIKAVDQFFPEYDEQTLQAIEMDIAQRAKQPDPRLQAEMQKAQAQIQAKQAEVTLDAQLKREEMELGAQIKREQIAAEMTLKRDQLEAELALQRELALMGAATGNGISGSVHLGGEPG